MDGRPRPITTTVEVCLRCGSTEPVVLSEDCAHPRVARVVALTPELADLVTHLRRARSYQRHAAEQLAAALELEELVGRARIDDEPDVLEPEPNVRFLFPRDERLRDGPTEVRPEPPCTTPPWSSAPPPPPKPPEDPTTPPPSPGSGQQLGLFGPGTAPPGKRRRR